MIAVHNFKQVHRQAMKSGILKDANLIRDNINPLTGKTNSQSFTTGELEDMHYFMYDDREHIHRDLLAKYYELVDEHGVEKVSIITPRVKSVLNSTETFNNKVQDRLLGNVDEQLSGTKRHIKVGAKVIQRVNNYDKNVVNGEVGFLTGTNHEDKTFTVKYPDKTIIYDKEEFGQVFLAYALSVHSFQGSQADHILISIDYSHYTLLDACLLYTAITRAIKTCWIYVERKAFNYAVRENKNRDRTTFMQNLIFNYNGNIKGNS